MIFKILLLSESLLESESELILPRSSPPAADLTAEMETLAQHRGLMDDSFHLPNFDPSALSAIVEILSCRQRTHDERMILLFQKYVSYSSDCTLMHLHVRRAFVACSLSSLVTMPSLRARFECIYRIVLISLSSPSASPIHIVSHMGQCLTYVDVMCCGWHCTTHCLA